MRIDSELLKKARQDKNLSPRLAIAINKSVRQVDRYIKANSFPDKFDTIVQEVFNQYL